MSGSIDVSDLGVTMEDLQAPLPTETCAASTRFHAGLLVGSTAPSSFRLNWCTLSGR